MSFVKSRPRPPSSFDLDKVSKVCLALSISNLVPVSPSVNKPPCLFIC